MRKLLPLILAVMLLFTVLSSSAEQGNDIPHPITIYTNLSLIYNELMEYLEQRQFVWGLAQETKASAVDSGWFYTHMALSDGGPERWTAIMMFFVRNGMCDYNTPPVKIYDELFLPIYEYAGTGDAGMVKALGSFIRLVFYDNALPDRLAAEKSAIRNIMAEDPDNKQLEGLQTLYKKVSLLMDYVNNADDSYYITAERISEFQQLRRELKSEYEFDFEWIDYSTATEHDVYEPYTSIYEARKQKTEVTIPMEITVGTTLRFGEWVTGEKGSVETIEWTVLDVQENEALLISKYGLETKPYNSKTADAIWSDCSLRQWLNSEFYNTAFTDSEKKAIKLTHVDNSPGQGEFDTDAGANTEDYLFALSYAEYIKYFKSAEEAICKPTPHTRNAGAYIEKNGAGYWWLRSPCTATFSRKAAVVASNGEIWYYFVFDLDKTRSSIDPQTYMARPAMWVDIAEMSDGNE